MSDTTETPAPVDNSHIDIGSTIIGTMLGVVLGLLLGAFACHVGEPNWQKLFQQQKAENTALAAGYERTFHQYQKDLELSNLDRDTCQKWAACAVADPTHWTRCEQNKKF